MAVGLLALQRGVESTRRVAAGGRNPGFLLVASFLLLIGMTLIAEGWDRHIPKGYIYSAMAFSVFVEMLNLRAARVRARRSGGEQGSH